MGSAVTKLCPLGCADGAMAALDLVLRDARVTLPAAEPPPPAEVEEEEVPSAVPSYELVLVESESGPVLDCAVLVPTQSGGGVHKTVRPLKGAMGDDVCVQVRESGATSALYTSASLVAEHGIGASHLGSLEEVNLGDEACTLSCEWRLQASLPPLVDEQVKFRTRELAFKYAAPNDRSQFSERTESWRLELTENRTKPKEQWTHEWRAPYAPHHLLGDPLTRHRRAEYIGSAAAHAELFHAQAIAVQLKRLQDMLPVCQTAEQASSAEHTRARADGMF